MHEYVEFGDIEVAGEIQKFYIFYDLGCGHTFHIPLCDDEEEEIAQNYANKHNLQIIDIGRLITYGDKIDDLISTQFVKKVLSLIESEDFTYVEARPESIRSLRKSSRYYVCNGRKPDWNGNWNC